MLPLCIVLASTDQRTVLLLNWFDSRMRACQGMSVSRWARSAKWTLLGSGLDKLETGLLKSVAALTGSQVVKRFSADVTHVICHLDDHHRAM